MFLISHIPLIPLFISKFRQLNHRDIRHLSSSTGTAPQTRVANNIPDESEADVRPALHVGSERNGEGDRVRVAEGGGKWSKCVVELKGAVASAGAE